MKFVRIGYSTPELAMVGTSMIYRYLSILWRLPRHKSHPKNNMAMENPQFEDVFIVFPIEHRDIWGSPANPSLRSSGVFFSYVNAAGPTSEEPSPKTNKAPVTKDHSLRCCEGRKLQGSLFLMGPILGRIKLDTNFYGFCCWGVGDGEWGPFFLVFCLG